MKHITSETDFGSSRRKFLQKLSIGSLATLALPSLAAVSKNNSVALPTRPEVLDEQYWQLVKKQFTVPDNLIMLNAANLCPSPFAISDKVLAMNRELNSNVSFQYRSAFTAQRVKALTQLAQFVGVSREEIGITRNTSESNCILVNGLDFKPGDEIIIWDQNHPSNGVAWEKRAQRSGLVVKKVSVPVSPRSKEELITPFAKAITSRTKLIAFSHVSNLSGIALPAKEICHLVKSKEILSLVDGAQTLGLMDLNLYDMGCDFFTASTHKWLMGPMENGMLYVSKSHIKNLWPAVIGGGWKDDTQTVDEKICVLGQRIETTTSALPEAIDFQLSIGKKVIEERVVTLNIYLKEQIRANISSATFMTPLSPDVSAGIVIINLAGKNSKEMYQKLYDNYGVACSSTGGIRLSPHIYNTIEDIDKVVRALTALAV
jgi:isopenicillin-N epimerase